MKKFEIATKYMAKNKYEFPAYLKVAVREFYISRSEYEIINDPTK
jgi:hypothetical protein